MPELIAQTNMDQQSVARLREELHKMASWMGSEKNILKYLSEPYERTTKEYQDRMAN